MSPNGSFGLPRTSGVLLVTSVLVVLVAAAVMVVSGAFPASLAITGTLGPFTGDVRYRLEPIESGTRLTNEVDLQPRGIVGLVGQLAGSRVEEAVAANLNELKRILESP